MKNRKSRLIKIFCDVVIFAMLCGFLARTAAIALLGGSGKTAALIAGVLAAMAIFIIRMRQHEERRKLVREYRELGLTTLEENE